MSKSRPGALLLIASLLLCGCSDWTNEVDGNYPEPYREPVEQGYEPPSRNEPPPDGERPWLQYEQDPERDLPEWANDNAGTTCQDVTSYDNDWSNDMLCTRPDGSQFYTDYEGAARHQ